MEARESLLNLAITCVLVLVVALVAVFLRNRRVPPMAIPVAIATPVNPTPSTSSPPTGANVAAALAKPEAQSHVVTERFQAFPKAKLVHTEANEADALRLRVGTEEAVFSLYFVDALDCTLTHTQRVDHQARHFMTTRDIVLASGRAAYNYVRDLLERRPFIVKTRWEKVPNLERYYALIIVEFEPGKQAYLADLLVKNGFAFADGATTPLPDDRRTNAGYAYELNSLARYAREKKLGVWSVGR